MAPTGAANSRIALRFEAVLEIKHVLGQLVDPSWLLIVALAATSLNSLQAMMRK
jgi:hypothetical protein